MVDRGKPGVSKEVITRIILSAFSFVLPKFGFKIDAFQERSDRNISFSYDNTLIEAKLCS